MFINCIYTLLLTSYRSVRVWLWIKQKRRFEMDDVKEGNRRIMVTLPEELIKRLEDDTTRRGLNLTKSNRIQLALETELAKSEKEKGEHT